MRNEGPVNDMTHEHSVMYVFRAGALDDANASGELWEYRVIGDSEIIGEIRQGPFFFTIWELASDTRPGTERALCLRVKHPYREQLESHFDATSPTGYYHGGGMAEEIVALSSLFLRRRLRADSVVRMGDLRMYSQHHRGRPIDPDLLEGSTNLEALAPWFQQLESFDPALHQRFILSVNFYQQALQRIEEDPTYYRVLAS